jgi:hypothetical protein
VFSQNWSTTQSRLRVIEEQTHHQFVAQFRGKPRKSTAQLFFQAGFIPQRIDSFELGQLAKISPMLPVILPDSPRKTSRRMVLLKGYSNALKTGGNLFGRGKIRPHFGHFFPAVGKFFVAHGGTKGNARCPDHGNRNNTRG